MDSRVEFSVWVAGAHSVIFGLGPSEVLHDSDDEIRATWNADTRMAEAKLDGGWVVVSFTPLTSADLRRFRVTRDGSRAAGVVIADFLKRGVLETDDAWAP